jgi:hypothetical protein
VVRGASILIVSYPTPERFPARVIGGDEKSQLAILGTGSLPAGIRVPDLAEPPALQEGTPIVMLQETGSGTHIVSGRLVGERVMDPLGEVLEAAVPRQGEIRGGVLLDPAGRLVGLALATMDGSTDATCRVFAVSARRILEAVERMVRREPGTQRPADVRIAAA